MTKEPVALAAAVVVLANSLIALLVLLDVFDAEVGAAIGLVVTNAVAVVGAVLVRNDVTPSANLPHIPVGPAVAPGA